MESRESILKYAGYMAYIASHALSECGGFAPEMVKTDKEPSDLTMGKCRWLVREFNNNIDNEGIRGYWRKIYNTISNHFRVTVVDMAATEWDEHVVLIYYQNADDTLKLMRGLRNIARDSNVDIEEIIGAWLGKSRNKIREYLGRTLFVPDVLLNAVRKAFPFDEGFLGRFHTTCEELKNDA